MVIHPRRVVIPAQAPPEAGTPSHAANHRGTFSLIKKFGRATFLSALLFLPFSLFSQTTQTYNYTGSQQTLIVPAGVSSITIEAWGAQGWSGTYAGGRGGYATGSKTVTPGQTIYIYVGGQGTGSAANNPSGAGWNGGGLGQSSGGTTAAGGGGGASDIRIGGTALVDRIIVAAGGGGATNNPGSIGGAGGGLNGSSGLGTYSPASGGTQDAGGTSNGSLGQGGNATLVMTPWNGGGGGGYYGGGVSTAHGPGGGGSSYIAGVTSSSTTSDQRSGNGLITITYTIAYTSSTFTNASATGRTGPTQNQVNTAYTSTNLAGKVTVNTQGIQEWTVPATGTYTFRAAGASGQNSTFGSEGSGITIQSDISLTAGQVIKIVVGQQGGANASSTLYENGGAGGGGSFVYTGEIGGAGLILAAGGGGGALSSSTLVISNTSNANYGTSGYSITDANAYVSSGGTDGNGGGFSNRPDNCGGPGSGWLSDYNPTNGSTNPTLGGTRFNGGIPTSTGRDGGFGGGGASGSNTSGAYAWSGGGGGYSGGGAGHNGGSGDGQVGGGGGSYLSGTNKQNIGFNTGNGFVTITYGSVATPSITVVSSLSSFSTCRGTSSAAQNFTASGSDLSTDITVTAPTGYEVSKISGTAGFAGSVTLTQSGGTVSSTTIYVRLTNAATGTPSGNISLTATDATTQNVAVSGSVTATSNGGTVKW